MENVQTAGNWGSMGGFLKYINVENAHKAGRELGTRWKFVRPEPRRISCWLVCKNVKLVNRGSE